MSNVPIKVSIRVRSPTILKGHQPLCLRLFLSLMMDLGKRGKLATALDHLHIALRLKDYPPLLSIGRVFPNALDLKS